MFVINAETVNHSLDFPTLIKALMRAFRQPYTSPNRSHVAVPTPGQDATLLMMPAWHVGRYLGVKIATVFPDNAKVNRPSVYANYLLMDGRTGEPLAMIEGRALTLWRTAAASGLAASLLARKDSTKFLMIGAGGLAPYFIRCYASLFPLESVAIWNRTPQRAEQLAASLDQLSLDIQVVPNLAEAVAHADIITSATLSAQPLIQGQWLQPGAHVDLVGGYTPAMREADDVAIKRSRVYVDTLYGGLHEAGDIIQPIQKGVISQQQIQGDLFGLCSGKAEGRTTTEEITLFKSVGSAVEDLAAAMLVYENRAGAEER